MTVSPTARHYAAAVDKQGLRMWFVLKNDGSVDIEVSRANFSPIVHVCMLVLSFLAPDRTGEAGRRESTEGGRGAGGERRESADGVEATRE